MNFKQTKKYFEELEIDFTIHYDTNDKTGYNCVFVAILQDGRTIQIRHLEKLGYLVAEESHILSEIEYPTKSYTKALYAVYQGMDYTKFYLDKY